MILFMKEPKTKKNDLINILLEVYHWNLENNKTEIKWLYQKTKKQLVEIIKKEGLKNGYATRI